VIRRKKIKIRKNTLKFSNLHICAREIARPLFYKSALTNGQLYSVISSAMNVNAGYHSHLLVVDYDPAKGQVSKIPPSCQNDQRKKEVSPS
jgi:hypothetical protein